MSHKYLSSIFIVLLVINTGCSQKQFYDPTKNPLHVSDINRLKTIHVMAPQISGCSADIDLYKYDVAGSAIQGGGQTAGGVLIEGWMATDPASIILLPIMIPAGAVVGTIMGASDPNKKPATPTDVQAKGIQNAFMRAIGAADDNNKQLQNYFISEGNQRGTIRFAPAEGCSTSAENNFTNTPNSASLYSTVETITFTGREAKDPSLMIKIGLRFYMKGLDDSEKCLGWYESVWEGETYRLSEWLANDGEYIRDGIVTAYKSEYQNAVSLLLSPKSQDHQTSNSTEIQTWTNCFTAQTQMILDHATWYCLQADQGIADPQRRIGDLFNYGGGDMANRDVIRAYVWYSLAAKGNNTDAVIRLNELEKELTPDQLEDAKERLGYWVPGVSGQCKKDLIESGLIR